MSWKDAEVGNIQQELAPKKYKLPSFFEDLLTVSSHVISPQVTALNHGGNLASVHSNKE